MQSIMAWNGKAISQPGLYSGVALDVYHSQDICEGPSVSSSGLRRILEINGGSPAHFYYEWSGQKQKDDDEAGREEKEALVLGRAAHHLLLGQPNFRKHFVVSEHEYFRTNAAKEWRAAQTRTIVRQQHVKIIEGMAAALAKNELLHPGKDRHGLLGRYTECSGFWRDDETGIWCKIRPDAIPTDSGDYADLKTTISVQHVDLSRTIADLAYHQQAALVAEGSEKVIGVPMAHFTFVFVEKAPPYCVQIVEVNRGDIAIGQAQNHAALRLLRRCIDAKDWPGPGAGHIYELSLTDRYRQRAEALLADDKLGRAA